MANAHTLSTSCTGVYTVEAAAAILEKTVNQSGLVDNFEMYFQSERCYDPLPNFKMLSIKYWKPESAIWAIGELFFI